VRLKNFFSKMVFFKFPPSLRSLNLFFKSLLESEAPSDSIMKAFYEARDLGLRFDVFTYIPIVKALQKQGKMGHLAKVYPFMQKEVPYTSQPHVHLLIFHTFVNGGALTMAMEVGRKIRENGVNIDSYMQDKLIEALDEAGRARDSQEVLNWTKKSVK